MAVCPILNLLFTVDCSLTRSVHLLSIYKIPSKDLFLPIFSDPEDAVHRIRDLVAVGRIDMPVCVERDPDRAMAQMGGDLLDIKPFGDQETRARMPQIVRAYMSNPRSPRCPTQSFSQRALSLRKPPMQTPTNARKYKIVIRPIVARPQFRRRDLCPLFAQCLDDDRREGDLCPR